MSIATLFAPLLAIIVADLALTPQIRMAVDLLGNAYPTAFYQGFSALWTTIVAVAWLCFRVSPSEIVSIEPCVADGLYSKANNCRGKIVAIKQAFPIQYSNNPASTAEFEAK